MTYDKEKVFEYLDNLRLDPTADDWTKREHLCVKFRMTQSEAEMLLEDYRVNLPYRKQFLQEGI